MCSLEMMESRSDQNTWVSLEPSINVIDMDNFDFLDLFIDPAYYTVQEEVVVVTTPEEDEGGETTLLTNLETLKPTSPHESELDSDGTHSPNMEVSASETLDLRKPHEMRGAVPNGFPASPPPSSTERKGCYGIDKPLYTAPLILMDTSESPDSNVCLDLSKTGPNASAASTLLHCSGGSSIDLTRNTGYDTNGYRVLLGQAPYYQLPRIKLQPGLGIDPTVQYNPEMDLNHNSSSSKPHAPIAIPTPAYKTIELFSNSQNEYASHGGSPVPRSGSSGDLHKVEVEEVPDSRIPLTVTSPDDDVDSGTESIDSKDSDSSLRLSPGNDDSPGSTDKCDRKRPGRKKGQVSKVYHLWEFIRDVLNDPRYSGTVIKWENEEEGIFRVCQSEVAAGMWGAKKNNRTKMTYEKMSRSIRYSRKEGYFDDLPKNKGYPKKLCFKFGKKALGWRVKKQSDRL